MATSDKILRNTGAQIEATMSVDGVPTDMDAPPVVTVVNPDGSTFQTGTADDAVAADGKYELSLGPSATLKPLVASWVGTVSGNPVTLVTDHEIVGAHLFTYADILKHEGELADTGRFPVADIVDVREEVTDFFTQLMGTSPVPRGKRVKLDGNNSQVLYLADREIQAITGGSIDGVDFTTPADDITFWENGRLYAESSYFIDGRRNVEIEYEYGLNPVPGPVSRAGMILATALLVGTDILDRSITATDETGTYRLSVPNAMRDNPTGIPFVDSILNSYREDWVIQT